MCLKVTHALMTRYELPLHGVLLYLYRASENKLLLVAPEFENAELHKSLALVDLVQESPLTVVDALLTKSRLLTGDITRSIVYGVAPQLVLTSSLSTLATLPLKVESEVVGVLEILLHLNKDSAERELSFLSVIANEIAIGISRRGLIDELRVKNIDLEIQRAQTQDAIDTLKRFLAYFSHELRSPLNSIIGFSDLIAHEFASLNEATIREYNSAIHTSGEHLLHLINDILDLSKIESGKMELLFSNIPIRNFLQDVQQAMFAQAGAKKIMLDLNVAEELDDMIADKVRLKQIVLNLVSNAVKFSRSESKIIISAKRVQNDIEFSVQDFGLGIRSEEINKLFQPFQQMEAGTKKHEGTGLGLAITKKLVELHGGSIFVVSEWQEGSTFIVRVPMMVHAEGETENVLQKLSELRGHDASPRRVLIVEDKPHARTLLRTYLNDAGYITEIATNGVEALEKAKIWKPDAITLDILLPVKDGWQVMRELKEHPLCKNIPVIIISMVDERNIGYGLGAVDYFVKPVQKEQLLGALKKITAERAPNKTSAKILVIDDDKSVTDLVQVILESEGCVVVKAHSGKEGLALAESEKPDLIILDLVMPDISGFNVAYQLKHNSATFTIPVMIMTSMEIDDETREQLEGFVVSLMKKSGFTKRDLLNEIASIEGKK